MIHPIFIVLSVCFLGSAALIPIMYLGIQGSASLPWIFGAAIIGTGITDMMWFFLARKLGSTRIEGWWIVRRNPEKLKIVERAVQKHGAKMLFWSKFIQGTGVLSQVAAGLFHVSWGRALITNFSGAAVVTILTFLITRGAASLSILEAQIANIRVGLIVFVGLFAVFYIIGAKIAPKEILMFANKNDLAGQPEDSNSEGNRNV
ncbi:MAG TPA: VTT domain-containing protein [Candidatus Paceibacterota bacterium]